MRLNSYVQLGPRLRMASSDDVVQFVSFRNEEGDDVVDERKGCWEGDGDSVKESPEAQIENYAAPIARASRTEQYAQIY
jgi:hypothetical protein